MYTIENKFEIGEECYTCYRKPIHYECPICKGKGNFIYNGYEIWCKRCNGTGKLHDKKQTVLAVCKVKIRRIIASICDNEITIKYKVNNIDTDFRVNNRSENNLFKSLEEAEEYCKSVNKKEIIPEF